MIKFSIIIPHKNSYETLIRLLDSIPNKPELEVIIVDDNSEPACKEKLQKTSYNENIKFIYDDSNSGAGKARNIGLDNLTKTSRWVLFADADDYFPPYFYQLINQNYDDSNDIIYFNVHSVFSNFLEKAANRHQNITKLINDYLLNPDGKRKFKMSNKNALKYFLVAPWGKMIKKKLIKENDIKFEEIPVSNDTFFGIKIAHYAKSITAKSDILYILTFSKNSLQEKSNKCKELLTQKLLVLIKRKYFLLSIGVRNKPCFFPLKIFKESYKNFGIKYSFFLLFLLIKGHKKLIEVFLSKIIQKIRRKYKNLSS